MNKVVITEADSKIYTIEYDNGEPVKFIPQNKESITLGSIYVGIVKNVKKDLQASFVEFSKGITGFLPDKETKGKIKQGDLIAVRVVNEPVKTKGYSLSMFLELSGKYLVVSDKEGGKFCFSSKLSKENKDCLSGLFSENEINSELTYLFRTNSVNNIEGLKEEFTSISDKLCEIISIKDKRSLYTCLYKEKPQFIKVIDDLLENSFDEIITDKQEIFDSLNEYYKDKVSLFNSENITLGSLYRIQHVISLVTDKKVNLPSGGYIIIEPTEAMTVIDVNTGKAEKKTKEDVIKKVNFEAADEIRRQLILRNISGMILIDFINFSDPKNEEELLKYMKELSKKDSVPTKVWGYTNLKIMELSRKKIRGSIYDNC